MDFRFNIKPREINHFIEIPKNISTPNERMAYAKSWVIQKLESAIQLVESTLSVKLNFKQMEKDNEILFHDMFVFFTYFRSKNKHYFKYKCPCNTINFPFLDLKFKVKTTSKGSNLTDLVLYFDDFFNLSSVTTYCDGIDNILSHNTQLALCFDSDMSLNSLIHAKFGIIDVYYMNKTKAMICPYSDEHLIFDLMYHTNDDVKTLLPECYVPSAYDFQSVDLQERLLLYRMMIF